METGLAMLVRYDIRNKDAVAAGKNISVREHRSHRMFIRTKKARRSYICQKVRRQALERLIFEAAILGQ